MEQNTENWLDWRNKGIGSSDAPIMLGISPYQTPFGLWEEKTGKKKKEDKNQFILNRGHKLEPYARAKYEFLNDIEMPAMLFEHKDLPYLRASMDGFNQTLKKGLEIKYVGKDVFEREVIPPHHMAQVQHQILVTCASSIDYVLFWCEDAKKPENGSIKIINIAADLDFIDNYIPVACEFWHYMQSDTPPALIDKDKKTITDLDLEKSAIEYLKITEQLKTLEKKQEDLKKILSDSLEEHPKIIFGNSKLEAIRCYRKGNVDYKKIPELKDIDLEPYRGKTISFPKFQASR